MKTCVPAKQPSNCNRSGANMPDASLESSAAKVMGLVFGKSISPDDSISMATEPAWDSMKHIELIMTLEQEFGVSFEPEEIPKLTSLSAVIAKLRELRAGAHANSPTS